MLTALLVTCAATLLESVPFILAGTLLAGGALRRCAWVLPYVSCGCGPGASARSLPAALATALVFGPAAAAARVAAAVAADRLRASRRACSCAADSLPAQLAGLAPVAAAGATVALFSGALLGAHTSAPIAFGLAALASFAASPCGLGAVGLAASLRVAAPAAAAGVLCVAGIADARTWLTRAASRTPQHDALAYALLALACGNVALHGGAGLVHPAIALALGVCAAPCAALAWHNRSHRAPSLRIAPAIAFAGSMLAVPPPQYHATETTLAGAFAGERVDFTGLATRTGDATTLVRYAITCCRADASPVVVRIDRAPRELRGWFHARGEFVERNGAIALRADRLEPIPPPADPFVYR